MPEKKKKKIVIIKKRSDAKKSHTEKDLKPKETVSPKTSEKDIKKTPKPAEQKTQEQKSKPKSPVEKNTQEEKSTHKTPYKKGATYKRHEYRKKDQEFEKEIVTKKKEEQKPQQRILPKEITITNTITIGELAKKLNIKGNELIRKMMSMGEMVTINQVIDSDTATLVCEEFGVKVKVVSLYEETKIVLDEEDKEEDYKERNPVVTIMGHVDHGKTLLLDTIRHSNIAEREAGKITQHIGAYKVKINFKGEDKYITFVDTPGHAAFTTMRARGAKVTDIVIIVVAADDGIMPQTIESINHAKEADVPIIVAINKIDLPGVEGNIEKIKQELTNYGLVAEEWGGDVIMVPISAKANKNIDTLLEAILLQAEILELKANYNIKAKGIVLEASLSKSRGAVATILVQHGILHIGEPFVCGIYSGKVRAMFDDWGNQLKEAGPSTPVLITGLDGVPQAGDPFQAVETEKYARQISQKRKELKKEDIVKNINKVTLDNLYEQIKKGKIKELKIVLKADVEGSLEALKSSLEKLSNDEVQVKIIHGALGEITDTDIMLASASSAIIIGFNVKIPKKVDELAKKENVNIRTYRIIYDAIEEVKKALEGLLEPLIKEEGRGLAEVKEIFKISKMGIVAGSIVTEGKVVKGDKARVVRDDNIIYEGKIEDLKRFKDSVKEVKEGQECGIYLGPDFKDIQPGDKIESYLITKLARTL